jgi:hypothetical protein
MIGWEPTEQKVTRDRVISALYTHGPCSADTVAALIALRIDRTSADDVEKVSRAVMERLRELGAMVATKAIALPGAAVVPVTLLYLRGNAP